MRRFEFLVQAALTLMVPIFWYGLSCAVSYFTLRFLFLICELFVFPCTTGNIEGTKLFNILSRLPLCLSNSHCPDMCSSISTPVVSRGLFMSWRCCYPLAGSCTYCPSSLQGVLHPTSLQWGLLFTVLH